MPSLDNTDGQGGYAYGTTTFGGQQAGTGPGGIDTQPDRYTTSGQYGGQESQTAGYADPTRNVTGGDDMRPADDDEFSATVGGGGPKGKPPMTSRAMGTSLPLSAVELCVGAN